MAGKAQAAPAIPPEHTGNVEVTRPQTGAEYLDSLRDDRTVARQVHFYGGPFQARKNFETVEYVQDRWTPREGLMFEAGLRLEWNEIVRDLVAAPREIAAEVGDQALGAADQRRVEVAQHQDAHQAAFRSARSAGCAIAR